LGGAPDAPSKLALKRGKRGGKVQLKKSETAVPIWGESTSQERVFKNEEFSKEEPPGAADVVTRGRVPVAQFAFREKGTDD